MSGLGHCENSGKNIIEKKNEIQKEMCIKILLSEREDSAQYSSLGVEKTNPKSCWVSMSHGSDRNPIIHLSPGFHLASQWTVSSLT